MTTSSPRTRQQHRSAHRATPTTYRAIQLGYAAVRDVLGDWPLAAPRDDTDLEAQLAAEIPAGTVVWLAP